MKLPQNTDWKPMGIEEIKTLIPSELWVLAGGYALELFAGKQYRDHGDIDIQINRKDQEKVFSGISPDRIYIAESQGKLNPFKPDRYYEKPIYHIWILNNDMKAWGLQIILYDTDKDGRFLFRRDETLSVSMSDLFFEKEGVRIIRPEIQILFKKVYLQGKDRIDFETIIPLLDKDALGWLENKMIKCYGSLWKFTS